MPRIFIFMLISSRGSDKVGSCQQSHGEGGERVQLIINVNVAGL